MRYMGWTIKAVYKKDDKGIYIPKYFTDETACEEFTKNAEKYGLRIINKEKI